MTQDEFDRWFPSHCGAFPGMRKWADDNPDAVIGFQECLADVRFDDAREATRHMNRGEYESPPFGEHARAVRKLARSLAWEAEQRSRRTLPPGCDEPRYSCYHCRDTGLAIVADIYVRENGRAPIKAFLDGTSRRLPECGVFCSCHRGRSRTPQLDAQRMFVIQAGLASDADAERFRDWWESHYTRGVHTQRIAAFDAYNAGGEF